MSKRTRETKPTKPRAEDAVAAAIAASKAAPPTLTDADRLQLFQAIKAADDAAAMANMDRCAHDFVRMIAQRQQAAQQSLDAANKLYTSLNTHPGHTLDPHTGTFTVTAH